MLLRGSGTAFILCGLQESNWNDEKRYATCLRIFSVVKVLFFAEKHGQLMAFLMLSICLVDCSY